MYKAIKDKITIIEKSIVTSIVLLVIDYYNLPSKIVSTWGNNLCEAIGISLFFLCFVHFFRKDYYTLFKSKVWTELDESIAILLLSCLLYIIASNISHITENRFFYLVLIITIVFGVILILRVLYLSLVQNYNEEQPVYTLKNICDDEFEVKDGSFLFLVDDVTDNDLLYRDELVNELRNTVRYSSSQKKTYTIGIEGTWGSGKSTLVSLAKLDQVDHDIKVIEDFDPWVFGNEEGLINGLYEEILKALGMPINFRKEKMQMKKIASIMASVSNQTWISDLMDNLGNEPYSNINEVKNNLTSLLNTQNKKFVFIFDNLDRASDENVRLLFRAIGTVFNLPHMVYILLYDQSRMDQIFHDASKINPKYMEKIINHIIYLYEPDDETLSSVYSRSIHNIIKKTGFNSEYVKDIDYYIHFLVKHIRDLRNFKRIVNSSLNRMSPYEGYLDVTVLLTLELLRFKEPDLYEKIYNHAGFFISRNIEISTDVFAFRTRGDVFINEQKNFFNGLVDKYKRYTDMLCFLFYDFREFMNNSKKYPEHKTSDINSAMYFHSYFTYRKQDFVKIVKMINDFIDQHNVLGDGEENVNITIPDDIYVQTEWANALYSQLDRVKENSYKPMLLFLWNHINDFHDNLWFMRLSARMNIYFTIQMLLTKLTNEQLDEFIQYVKENNARSNVYSMQRIDKCLERKDMAVDNKIKEKWNKLYEDTCNDIITNKVDLYSNQYYCHRNMIGITTYANVKHVDIKDYMQSIIKLKYVYRILGDFVGSSVGSMIHYYLSESLINQVGLDPSTINRFIDQNPPVSHDEKFIEMLWDQFLKGEKDEFDHYSVEWNQIELLENL